MPRHVELRSLEGDERRFAGGFVTPVISKLVPLMVTAGLAFANVEVGSPLPNSALEGVDGVEGFLVDSQKVTAFLFFDPGQDRSRDVLGALAELQPDLEDTDVRWIGVVSDRFPTESVATALADSGARLEIVIDAGDQLYGELGVRLYPTMGIVDSEAVLRAYLPYAKVNYMTIVEAHLRHTLGQIDDAALEAALTPTSVDVSSQEAEVGRALNFARVLWDKGKRDKALSMARKAEETAPDLADPHALVGVFLVEMDRCEEARLSLDRALEIDPNHSEARAALLECPSP